MKDFFAIDPEEVMIRTATGDYIPVFPSTPEPLDVYVFDPISDLFYHIDPSFRVNFEAPDINERLEASVLARTPNPGYKWAPAPHYQDLLDRYRGQYIPFDHEVYNLPHKPVVVYWLKV